jgi:hypothetical protein
VKSLGALLLGLDYRSCSVDHGPATPLLRALGQPPGGMNLSVADVSSSRVLIATIGFRQVRVSRIDLLTASERQRLDEDGFLTLRNIVPPSRLTAMRKRLEA